VTQIEEIGSELCPRLRARRVEIEQEILARINSVPDQSPISDPEYREGLRATVSAAVDYGIAELESNEAGSAPIPGPLLAQARLAARSGVRLDSVVRRYLAGHTLLGNFVIEESAKAHSDAGPSLTRLLQRQASTFDAVIVAVTEEYRREREKRFRSRDERLADQVKRILAGEPPDITEPSYDFDGWHLATIVDGKGSNETMRALSRALDCRLLAIEAGDGRRWAWLGSPRQLEVDRFREAAPSVLQPGVRLAFGEPAAGIAGWRLSHRQAKAALLVAKRTLTSSTFYADVALLASSLQDDLLVTSLWQIYLSPLEGERDEGAVARRTLQAYFDSDRNVSSAAASLQVSRRTVASRLRSIEERLGRPLNRVWAEIEVALRLADHHPNGTTPVDH
jgi:hypothetical protein